MLVVKAFGAKDIGEESPRFTRKGPSHVLSDRMPAEPGPRRFGPDAARGRASVASTCDDLHVAGSHPHALRPGCALAASHSKHPRSACAEPSTAAVFADRRSS